MYIDEVTINLLEKPWWPQKVVFFQRVIKFSSMNVTITKSRLVFRLVIFARWLLFANFIKTILAFDKIEFACLVNYTINVHTLKILLLGFHKLQKEKVKAEEKTTSKEKIINLPFFDCWMAGKTKLEFSLFTQN